MGVKNEKKHRTWASTNPKSLYFNCDLQIEIENWSFEIGNLKLEIVKNNWKFGRIHLEILKKLEIWQKMKTWKLEMWKSGKHLEICKRN